MKTRKVTVWSFLRVLILVLVMLAILIPTLWMFLSAFKPMKEIIAYPPRFFPEKWTFGNFEKVFTRIDLSRYIVNTCIYAVVSTILSVFINALAAYGFARFDFPGKQPLFFLVLGTMMIPFQVIMVPLFLEVYQLGMFDSYAGLILPKLAIAMSIFMMRASFETLPVELDEAARIDGMKDFQILARIMIPLVKPTLVTMIVLNVNGAWNDLLWPLLVTSSAKMRMLANGLALFAGKDTTMYGAAFAGAVVSVVPMMLLYIFGSRYFVEGVTTSGLKG